MQDLPPVDQNWSALAPVGHGLHGNFGYSYKLNQSVTALFQERWARSLYLSGMALVLSLLIAVPLGIYQAVRRNSFGDQAGLSIPAPVAPVPELRRPGPWRPPPG